MGGGAAIPRPERVAKSWRVGWPAAVVIAVLGLLLVGSARSFGAELSGQPSDDYVITNWEVEDGLPGNSATAMVQTPDGFLWFGTFDGLVRFDGAAFEVFDESNTPGLPGADVVNVHVDADGRLWVSALEGLAVREGEAWRTLGPEVGWTADVVRSFAERDDGAILFSNFDGSLLEWTGERFRELPPPPGDAPSTICAADAEGRWWVARPDFVGSWDGERWTPVAERPEVREGIGCAPSRDGGVWVLTGGGEIRKYRDGEEVRRRTIADLPRGVWGLFEDSSGYLWLSTHDAGLCRISPDGTWAHWDMGSGFSSNGVRFVFEDRERTLWVGTSGGGLSRFKARRVWSYGAESGIAERVVNSLWPASDGGVLVGTYGKGVFRLDPAGAVAIPLTGDDGPLRYVQSVLEDRAGRVWVGSFGDGLWILDGTEVRRPPAEQTGGINVIALFEDSTGRVWVSGGEGVAVFEEGRPRETDGAIRAPIPGVCAFAEERGGDFLVSNKAGVFRLRGGALEEIVDPAGAAIPGVVCLRADDDGTIWMGTTGTGLLRWRAGRLDGLDRARGLPARSVYGIIEDDAGCWWLSTERGIVRVARSELEEAADGAGRRIRAQVLGVEDGKAGSECSGGRQPVCGRSPDGRIWFATPRGVSSVDPAAFRLNEVVPPVLVRDIGFELAPERGGEGAWTRLSPPFNGPVVVPPGARHVEIRYAGLSYASPGEMRFEVMMEGLERGWREVGADRSAVFFSLPAGDYRFRVRAANDDGLWNEEGAGLALRVSPHYWETRWFLGAALATVIGGSAGAAWWAAGARFRQRRRAEDRFQRVVEAAPNAMIVVDGAGRISLVNSQTERVFGYPREDLVGKPVDLLLPEGLGAARRDRSAANGVVRRPPGPGGEIHGVRGDGTRFPIELAIKPVQTEQGTSTLASITDITERKRTELELALQRNELAHLSRVTMLGELSGSMAHELNQPLTAILSNAQAAQRLLGRDPLDMEELRDILGDIVEQDKRAGEVIHRLRALLQKGETRHQPLEIADVVKDVLRLMRSDLINHGVRVTSEFAADLPGVDGDRVQIQQVLLNLLLNACDAMSETPRETRSLEVRAIAADGGVRVSVEDSGPGFPPEDAERLFRPFYTTKASGMGLGLAVCRTIMRSHGGDIRAERNAAGGATFSFSLPARERIPGA